MRSYRVEWLMCVFESNTSTGWLQISGTRLFSSSSHVFPLVAPSPSLLSAALSSGHSLSYRSEIDVRENHIEVETNAYRTSFCP